MDLLEFDPKVRHTFTFDGKGTSLIEGDTILMKEVNRDEKKSGGCCALHFARQNAFIHVDGMLGIRFDRAEDFEWLVALIALTHGYQPVRHTVNQRAFRLVKQE